MFRATWTTLCKLFRDRSGATAIEYGLLVAMVTVVSLGAFVYLGQKVGGQHDSVASRVTSALN